MPAGYSGTPLVKKLGIKSGQRLALVNQPEGYSETMGPMPDGVKVARLLDGPLDFIHFFTTGAGELEREFPQLKSALSPDGTLWVSWPKRSSRVATDLNGNVVRDIGLGNGLVDVKVCAVDETWSALKFVFRLKDRT